MKLMKTSGWIGMVALTATAALTGCGLGPTDANPINTFGNAGMVGGKIYGGQQPVQFATVKLYAAGTTGYGSTGTLLATSALTGADGSFTFTKSGTNGSSSGTGTTWACPATSDDPQLYVLANGGNSSGNGLNDAADTNSAITLLAAIGPCSGVTNSTFVTVDELSTATAAFALSAYINPGATAGTETIGTNGTNLPTSTPQAAVGLNNAVLGIPNLKVASTTYAGTQTSVASVQITATPEAGKMNAIADILAACVNTQTQASSNCSQLFNAALSKTGTKPVDILQAAYYMATNPTDAGTFTACGLPTTNIGCLFALAAANSPFPTTMSAAPTDWTVGVTYAVSNYNVTTGAGTCNSNGNKFFDGPAHAAVDASGNIYIINGSPSKAAMVEMSPIGQPLRCVNPLATSSPVTYQTYGLSLTIDPTGDVWGAYSHATNPGFVHWQTSASESSTTTTTFTSAAQVNGIVSDGDGNIFYTGSANGGTLFELVAPITSSSTPTQLLTDYWTAGGSTATTIGYIAADSAGRIHALSTATSQLLTAYPVSAPITSYSIASNVATFTAANSFTAGQVVDLSGFTTGTMFNGQKVTVLSFGLSASQFEATFTASTASATVETTAVAHLNGAGAYTAVDTGLATSSYGLAVGGSANNVWVGTACCGSSSSWGKASKFTPKLTVTAATGASSAQYLGGMNGARAVAVDGAGNAWLGEQIPAIGTTPGGTYGLVELSSTGSTFAAVSPTGTTPSSCTVSSCATGGGFQKADFLVPLDIEIDPSGNVWVLNSDTNTSSGTTNTLTNNGTTVTEIVGAATPTVTPLSVAAANGTLGAKP